MFDWLNFNNFLQINDFITKEKIDSHIKDKEDLVNYAKNKIKVFELQAVNLELMAQNLSKFNTN